MRNLQNANFRFDGPLVYLCLLGDCSCFSASTDFFFKSSVFTEKPLSVSNSLDPDQARQNVGPDLGPNCLQWLSVDTTLVGKELNIYQIKIFSGLMPV